MLMSGRNRYCKAIINQLKINRLINPPPRKSSSPVSRRGSRNALMPFLESEPPPPAHSHASRLLQNPGLSSQSHRKFPLASVFCMVVYICFHAPSPFISPPPSSPLPWSIKSVLWVCIFIAALRIGSQATFYYSQFFFFFKAPLFI